MNKIPAELIEKFNVHEAIVKATENGLLSFCGPNEYLHGFIAVKKNYLTFEIPSLQDHDSCVELYWHGSDSKTWSFEGLRFYVERVYDIGGNKDIWSPEHTGDNQTTEDHELNVDDFIGWLESQSQ